QCGPGGGEAAGQVGAVIGIADRGVELGEVVALRVDDRRDLRYPGSEELSVHVRSSRYWTMSPDLPPPPQTGCFHRRVPQLRQRVGQPAYGYRETLHLQTGDVISH